MFIRTTLTLTLVLAVACAGMAHAAEEKADESAPAAVVQRFITAVTNEDRDTAAESFDFEYAYGYLSYVMEQAGTEMTFSKKQTKNTLLYHFLSNKMRKQMAELTREGVTFQQRMNKDAGAAQVLITKPEVKTGDAFPKETPVGLRWKDKQWKVATFPEFFPLDYFEVLTGTEAWTHAPRIRN